MDENTKDNTDTQSNQSRWSNYSESFDDESLNERDEDDNLVMTRAYLKKMLKEPGRGYFSTPECNDILYINQRGFKYFRQMDIFPNLKCLYFQLNGLRSLYGLEKNTNLISLFVQQNFIKKIEGLESQVNLRVLNLQ
jgi:hypothetical protein